MKSNLIVFFLVFSILMTGCGYSFETNETLDAYLDVVEKVERNNTIAEENIVSKIYRAKDRFKKMKRYQELGEGAEEAFNIIKEFNDFIDKINRSFYQFAETGDDSFLNFQNLGKNTLRNQQPVKTFFITGYRDKKGNFIEPRGVEIKTKLKLMREKLIAVLVDLSGDKKLGVRDDEIRELASKWTIQNSEIFPSQNDWVEDIFGNKSVAATHTNLTMFKNDALITADMIVSYLAYKISWCGPTFDRFVVVSSPIKNYVKMGETFESIIFLSAASSDAEFTATINGKTYPVEDGVILYEAKPNKRGTHTYEAEITIKNPHTKKESTYKKTFKYEVGECYH